MHSLVAMDEDFTLTAEEIEEFEHYEDFEDEVPQRIIPLFSLPTPSLPVITLSNCSPS